jgi:uncharacterized protein DUF1566
MGNGVISDGPSGLDWTKEDNGVGINWDDARAWCERKGSGWRLPTADELRRLYDDSPGRTTPCGQLTCKTPPGFRLTSWWFWSGEAAGSGSAAAHYDAQEVTITATLAWGVDLAAGRRLARDVGSHGRRALCVRRS